MNDLQRYLVHEFVADYQDGYLPRRELIRRVLAITGSLSATAVLLTSLGCGPSTTPGAAQTGTTGGGAAPTPAAPPPTAASVAAAATSEQPATPPPVPT